MNKHNNEVTRRARTTGWIAHENSPFDRHFKKQSFRGIN